MSLNYYAVCKNSISINCFKIKYGEKYLYRKAINNYYENAIIVTDSKGYRQEFNILEFRHFFFTDQELRKKKIEKIYESNL